MAARAGNSMRTFEGWSRIATELAGHLGIEGDAVLGWLADQPDNIVAGIHVPFGMTAACFAIADDFGLSVEFAFIPTIHCRSQTCISIPATSTAFPTFHLPPLAPPPRSSACPAAPAHPSSPASATR